MIDRLIEGKLVTLAVGSLFRAVEIIVRTVHISVRGIRILIQESITSRIDRRVSAIGKRLVARRARVDRRSVVLVREDGEYTGDLKQLAEELRGRDAPVSLTWALADGAVGPFPRDIHLVRHGSAAAFRAIARAKVVVQDGSVLQHHGAVKSTGQSWIQFVGTGRAASTDARSPVDLVLLADNGEDAVARRSFGTGARIERSGHPRTDPLLRGGDEAIAAARSRVLDRLRVPDTGQRFVLIAPGPAPSSPVAPVSGIDLTGVRASLAERFGGSWEILIRTGARGQAESDALLAGLPAFCRNVSPHPDLYELLLAADAAITDRGRWMADYLLTGRPAFRYTTAATASDPRGGLPLDVAATSRELLESITRFDADAHRARVASWLDAEGVVADGSSAARAADAVLRLTTS